MLDIVKIEELITVITTVLVAVQMVINYLLPPEKAEKFNIIGKVLSFLAKTKAGLSGSTK